MKPYTHNKKEYKAGDPVPWPDAIEVGGFYFAHAKYLGLPEPPAAFVFDDSSQEPEILTIIGKYHELFRQAEADLISRVHLSDIGKIGGSKTSEKKTAAVRKNAKKGGWPKGRPRKPKV